MKTTDQYRALLAYDHVKQVAKKPKADQTKYATQVYHAPGLIRRAGLCQALHFIHSRHEWGERFVEHLQGQVKERLGVTDLLGAARKADTLDYLLLTREVLACADWYVRFVQSILKVEKGAGDE